MKEKIDAFLTECEQLFLKHFGETENLEDFHEPENVGFVVHVLQRGDEEISEWRTGYGPSPEGMQSFTEAIGRIYLELFEHFWELRDAANKARQKLAELEERINKTIERAEEAIERVEEVDESGKRGD